MNRTEYLLTVVAEECAEVAQRAAKAARFGLDQIQVDPHENPDGLTNRERIVGEYNDLIGTLQMLGLDVQRPGLQQKKQAKVTHYLERGAAEGDRAVQAAKTGRLPRTQTEAWQQHHIGCSQCIGAWAGMGANWLSAAVAVPHTCETGKALLRAAIAEQTQQK